MGTPISAEDVGKRVVNDGDTIGRVVTYEAETAFVDPDPDLSDVVKSKFGWATTNEETFPLQRELVDEVTDDEIRLVAKQ